MSDLINLADWEWLVHLQCRRYRVAGDAEAISRAWYGLHRAAETHDPAKGRSFESWATWYIRSKLRAMQKSNSRRAAKFHLSEHIETAYAAPAPPDVPETLPEDALDVLSPGQRRVVETLLANELNHTAAAEALGTTRQNVSLAYKHALRKLRDVMVPGAWEEAR